MLVLFSICWLSLLADQGVANLLRASDALPSKSKTGLNKRKKEVLTVRRKPFDSRIINGSPVPNKDVYPWFVQGPDGSCGASLIGENLVLTAAHCAVVYPVGAVLHIGNIELDDPTAERRTISRTYMHEAYNDFTLENDVMVLLLDSPSSAPPVELNSDVLTEVGQVLTVMGFGVTETGMSSKVLREVDVNLVSDSRCNTNYGGDISASLMLCAAASDKDSCQGDSGGPLVDASGAQVGIVSFGIGCADPSYPGVYAEVAGLYDWIVRAGCLNLRGSASFCDSIDIPPTVAPTEYEGELFVVTISVTHDRYPRETSWDFLDPSGALVPGMSQAPGSVTVPSSTVTAEASVPPGLYRFRIFDTLEDGICCQYGFGRVLIEVNGVVFVDSSGEFASSAFADIDVGGVPETLAPTLAPTSPAPVTPIPTNPLPTMSPTPAPTPAQTFSGSPKPTASTGSPEDRFAVSLLVKHDEYPEETSWEILDSNGLVLVSQSFNSSVSSGELVSEELSLSEGSYTLSLKDSYGDGVCCTHGNGYVVVKVGSRTVVDSDGTYGGGKDFPFIVSDAPPQSSTTYELAFTADSYPFEVSFSLVGEGGVVVLDSNSLIFPDSGETAVYELTLTPGMSYTLTVNDSWGDGICCVHGDGQIEVYALLGDGTKETLVAPLGSFGESITSVFVVPGSTTATTAPPPPDTATTTTTSTTTTTTTSIPPTAAPVTPTTTSATTITTASVTDPPTAVPVTPTTTSAATTTTIATTSVTDPPTEAPVTTTSTATTTVATTTTSSTSSSATTSTTSSLDDGTTSTSTTPDTAATTTDGVIVDGTRGVDGDPIIGSGGGLYSFTQQHLLFVLSCVVWLW